ncbi:hypothetical protein GCM10028817_01430 [Spirosoma pomorum]
MKSPLIPAGRGTDALKLNNPINKGRADRYFTRKKVECIIAQIAFTDRQVELAIFVLYLYVLRICYCMSAGADKGFSALYLFFDLRSSYQTIYRTG